MKNLTNILLLLLSFLSFSCSVEEPSKNPDLVSKWELMEVLQYEGENAVYRPAQSKETVEFLVDSRVRRSVSWCQKAQVTIATYSSEANHILAGCSDDPVTISYKIKGDLLFLYPNCEEACTLKYRRIDNLVGFVK